MVHSQTQAQQCLSLADSASNYGNDDLLEKSLKQTEELLKVITDSAARNYCAAAIESCRARSAIERGQTDEAKNLLKPLVKIDFASMQNSDQVRAQLIMLMSVAGMEQEAEILKKDIEL